MIYKNVTLSLYKLASFHVIMLFTNDIVVLINVKYKCLICYRGGHFLFGSIFIKKNNQTEFYFLKKSKPVG